MGALSVTGQPKYRDGFGPLVTPGPLRAVRRRRRRARRASPSARPPSSSSRSRREGGINLPPPGYLQELRRACTDAGAVLIFDEIQTGSGPHRDVLRVRGGGRRPRRRDAGQGAGGRRPHRRDAGQRGGRARVRAGHARLDVRRQPVRHRRGAVRPAGDRRAGPARSLPRDGRVISARRCCGWPSGGGPRRAARAGGACCRG